MRFWLPALIALAVLPLSAHHPFTPFFDASKPASITGVITEVRFINPHIVVIVEGKGPDGSTGRWAFEGPPPLALQRDAKNYKQKLKPGTRITITGWAAKDPKVRGFSGREITFADGSTMHFGPTPEEGDRWSCVGPCTYNYSDLLVK